MGRKHREYKGNLCETSPPPKGGDANRGGEQGEAQTQNGVYFLTSSFTCMPVSQAIEGCYLILLLNPMRLK